MNPVYEQNWHQTNCVYKLSSNTQMVFAFKLDNFTAYFILNTTWLIAVSLKVEIFTKK